MEEISTGDVWRERGFGNASHECLFWHSRQKRYVQMGCARAAAVPRTVECPSLHPGEGQLNPCAKVLHSQGRSLSQLRAKLMLQSQMLV